MALSGIEWVLVVVILVPVAVVIALPILLTMGVTVAQIAAIIFAPIWLPVKALRDRREANQPWEGSKRQRAHEANMEHIRRQRQELEEQPELRARLEREGKL